MEKTAYTLVLLRYAILVFSEVIKASVCCVITLRESDNIKP